MTFDQHVDIHVSYDAIEILGMYNAWADFREIVSYVRTHLPGAKLSVSSGGSHVVVYICGEGSSEYGNARDMVTDVKCYVLPSFGERKNRFELFWSTYEPQTKAEPTK